MTDILDTSADGSVDAAVAAAIATLWPAGDSLEGTQVHMLVDGAADPQLAARIRLGKLDHDCLFAGPLTARLQAAAPWLVHLSAASAQTRELIGRAACHQGILVTAPAHVSTRQLRLHFKKLLWVRDESGRELYFRFYDPRVLAIYLPTCTPEEKRIVFGPAQALHCMDADGLRSFHPR
ncbi:DUF4123 domain-containing protein [Pseudoduganella plicata]|uniref:DUF4123 domain-containing protein n=1 Tax=Pseudoduganella plicata TaxID=321984 RepID=A0A4P7B9Y0_9BURK|nr:DUF4123 domain-containing protein [Pseudoduganella plicata]QBQ35366.1 DUF4123 domain-containing protein [Pseudoduganella plicata]GGZ01165.1 hypothetical protein GCM10007388_38540 [Pseudoduganella plicata]